MNFDYLNIADIETLPSPRALFQELPCNSIQRGFIESSREQIKKILDGTDRRFLLILGPCSIHDITAAKEYAIKLRTLAHLTSDTFYIVMRTYFEKPRTALGWKGFLYDPFLNGSHHLSKGIRLARKLLLDLADMEVPTATEFLDPASMYYLSDLISWGCIGARTTSSQTHRQMASGLSMPVAFKNSTDGNVECAINGVLSSSMPHHFIGMNPSGYTSMIHTLGNSYGHVVLRGGEKSPNFDPESISYTLDQLQKMHLPLRLLIDCSHDNSFRNHEQQKGVFKSIIKQVEEGNHHIRGLLLESHLVGGNQNLIEDTSKLKYGISITDPCLDWQATEELISWAYQVFKKGNILSRNNVDDLEYREAHL